MGDRERRETALIAQSEQLRLDLVYVSDRLSAYVEDLRTEVARREHERKQRDVRA